MLTNTAWCRNEAGSPNLRPTQTSDPAAVPRFQPAPIWNSDLSGSREDAVAFVRAHPACSQVEVFYDPDRPDITVLVPGAHESFTWFLIGAPIVLIVVGAFGLIRAPHLAPIVFPRHYRRRPCKSKPMPLKVSLFLKILLFGQRLRVEGFWSG